MRRLLAPLLLTGLLLAAPPAHAANPWLERRVLDLAHQGGEKEAPSSTMYAFKRAVKRGADMLELDVHGSRDGRLMVVHDATVDRTTNGSGRVGDLTARAIQRLDAAHWFVRGRNAVRGEPRAAYSFRGVRTGKREPPGRYRPSDFRIPTLEKVLRTFPNVPVNIEIKGNADSDQASFDRNATLLARSLNRHALPRADELIVVSFNQFAVDRFHRLAPAFGVAPGVIGVAGFTATGLAPPGTVALQVPLELSGIPVATADFVRRAHASGYAVHVFTSGDDEETPAVYRELVRRCVDGVMTSFPARFERFLERDGVAGPGRADGRDPC